MSEKIDDLLKNVDPAKNFQPSPVKAFEPRKRASAQDWFATQTRGQRFATLAGAFVVVVGLATSLVSLAPHSTAPILTLGQGTATASLGGDAGPQSKTVAGVAMPWVRYEYQAADNFSGESASTAIYRLTKVGSPKQVLSAIANVVGVKGTVETYDEKSFGPDNYYIGSIDGTKPTVSVNWSGMASWSFSDPTATPQCLPEPTDGSTVTGWCTLADGSTQKQNFPSETEAAAQAQRIFAVGGLDVPASEIKITKDDYSMWAVATLSVAGQPTAVTWQAGWSSTGQLAYAYGQSIKVEKVSDVATIDAKAAIDRLADWRWSGQAAESFYPVGPIAYSEAASDGMRMMKGDATTTPPDQTTSPTEEPAGVPTPETQTFLVTKATAALLLVWDADGNAWLVPGYVFEGQDTLAGAVIAVADGVIKLPDPTDSVMPMVK